MKHVCLLTGIGGDAQDAEVLLPDFCAKFRLMPRRGVAHSALFAPRQFLAVVPHIGTGFQRASLPLMPRRGILSSVFPTSLAKIWTEYLDFKRETSIWRSHAHHRLIRAWPAALENERCI